MRPPILTAAEAPNTYLAARFYAALGMSVLPCTGKKPSIGWSAFQQRAATPETIDRWREVGLLENVGIVCGKVSGNLVVIDLDGDFAWEAFDWKFPRLTSTYRVASGSGHGAHLYYYVGNLPPTTRVIGSQHGNIELRANGCYVVAPPSIHPSGKPYKVAYAAEIMWLPDMNDVADWIKLLIRRKHGGQMPPPANGKITHKTAYGAAALRSEAAEVRLSIPGERNARLYRAALKMGSLIADGKIDRASVERELLNAAAHLSETDGEAATLRTIASGIDQGLESPRDQWEAVMTRGELITLNRRLAEFSERFCPGCKVVFPLDQQHWYWSRKGRDRSKLRPSSLCKRCHCLDVSVKQAQAYRSDPEFRARKRQYRQSVIADPVKHERKKASARRYKRRKQREALEAVLAGKGVGGWQQ